MPLYRFSITPKSAWATPMRSDTLSGLLLYRLAEDEGEQALQAEINAFNSEKPPFVLSSAMPVGAVFSPKLPPIPRQVFAKQAAMGTFIDAQSQKPLSLFEALQQHKVFRKKRFLPLTVWKQHRTSLSTLALFADFCREPALWNNFPSPQKSLQKHVTINRQSGMALDGDLFSTCEEWQQKNLHLYARTDNCTGLLKRLKRIGELGFGRDSGTGRGLFDIERDKSFQVDATEDKNLPHSLLLSVLSAPDLAGLSGYFATEVKTGKVGPGYSKGNPFKRPFICVSEGALLTTLPHGPFVLHNIHANPAIVQVLQPLLLPCKLANTDEEN